MGDHEIVPGYRREWLRRDLTGAAPADRNFWPETTRMLRFFGNRPDKRYKEFRRELHPDWIYFLTDQQLGFVSSVMKRYRRASRDRPAYYFAVGGPGTGKTSVLVKLSDRPPCSGRSPGFREF